jgi:DNA-binding phage protein
MKNIVDAPHYHWLIIAGSYDASTDRILNAVDVRVVAKNEKEAMAKAQLLINRPNYITRALRECYASDNHTSVANYINGIKREILDKTEAENVEDDEGDDIDF